MSAVNPIGIHALVWVGDDAPQSVTTAITNTKDGGVDVHVERVVQRERQ